MKTLILPIIVVLAYILEAIGHTFGFCFHGLLVSVAGLSACGEAGIIYHKYFRRRCTNENCRDEKCDYRSDEKRDQSVLPIQTEPR